MTEEQIDDLIDEIDKLAQRLGCRFVPDPEKIAALKAAAYERDRAEALDSIGWFG